MKTLKFKSHLVQPILDKTKTSTWRLFDDKGIVEGDKFEFVNSDTQEVFAKAIATLVIEKSFQELTDDDWVGQVKFDSEKEMYKTFSKYYNKKVDKSTLIKIINFKIEPSNN